MRTDVRVIACTVAVLFVVALACMAAGMVLVALVPFAGLLVVCNHIDKNKAYYEGQIDDLCGTDNELR